MPVSPFRGREGFDAHSHRLINLADPALASSGLTLEPLDGVNWQTLRAHTGIRIVADDAARSALEALPAELIDGDIVVEQLTGTAWRWRASPQDWVPFGRGGITYAGRQANLPTPATATLTSGDMYVVRMDFSGEELYRLCAWDETLPNGGGWRWLNRQVWSKNLRADPDQLTDQRPGDLQITRESDHHELKAWNDTSGQWDTIYSRDQINAAIAALSLFEGTADQVGGGAIGAVEFDALPDLVAMSASGDLSLTSHYWTYIGSPNYPVTTATPGIGPNLDGAVLNPGDWIQISNQGGDGTGTGANGGPPNLQWVTIGGDLLAKARADRLFGLQPWAAGGWEQGALVVASGDVYRATRPVTAQDPSPNPTPTQVQITLSGKVDTTTVTGSPLDSLPDVGVADGDVFEATGSNGFAMIGGAFLNMNYNTGDHFVYSTNPALAGAGVTSGGFRYDQGWVYLGGVSPIPDPVPLQIPATATPWAKVDISGGLKVSPDMAGLPNTAPPGQVWIVLAGAGAKQELYSFDMGTGQWQELGGGGTPLDLAGGVALVSVGVPIGSVTAFAGSTEPAGWIACDGRTFSASQYPQLQQVLGGLRVPDLRGQFVRGGTPQSGFTHHRWTTGMPHNSWRTGLDGGHRHEPDPRLQWHSLADSSSSLVNLQWGGDTDVTPQEWTSYEGDHHHTIHGGDAETAPDHVILMYIIKATESVAVPQTP